MKPVIFSFFSGAGFLDLGFEKSGFEMGYVNELHKPFLDAYKYSRKKLNLPEPTYGYFEGDIQDCVDCSKDFSLHRYLNKVRAKKQLVGFIGGPPCPDFSVGGKNRGQHGDNGRLSQSFADLVCNKKPDFFLFENVRGLWRTKKHREFYDSLKAQFEQAGYVLTDKLVNAIEYGVPQDRERILLFGILKKHCGSRPASFLEQHFDWEHGIRYSRFDVLNSGLQKTADRRIPRELTVAYWFTRNAVATHFNAPHRFAPRAGLEKFKTIEEGDASKKSYKRLHRLRYSPTAAYGNNEVHIHPTEPRRISVAEALAIQSLPKTFVLPSDMTLTNMFKATGNGVPYLLSKAAAEMILKFLKETKHEAYGKQYRQSDLKAPARSVV